MKKTALLLVGIVTRIVLGACNFSADVSLDTTDSESPQLAREEEPQLTRAEILALQHMEESHEITQEELQARLLPFLGNGLGRSAGGTQSVVVGVERHMSVIENGFTQRGRSGMRASEIPFYVFTLEDPIAQTQGFALASGDARIGCILAVVEYGEIDVNNPFHQIFFSQLNEYILETIEIYNNITAEDIQAAAERREEITNGFGQFVHSNLGLGGRSNGWYRSGMFDTRRTHCSNNPPPVIHPDRDRPTHVFPPLLWENGPTFQEGSIYLILDIEPDNWW